MSNEDVARYLTNVPCFTDVAKELCYEATILGSSDNVTVVVVDLKTKEQSHSTQQNVRNITPLSSPKKRGGDTQELERLASSPPASRNQ